LVLGTGTGIAIITATLGPISGSATITVIEPSSNASAEFAYVANQGGNTISGYVIDPVSGVLNPVPGSPFVTGTGPRSVAADPTGHYVYVPNEFVGTVSNYKIDCSGCASVPPAPAPP
jgi:6-phosphogluconolactonase